MAQSRCKNFERMRASGRGMAVAFDPTMKSPHLFAALFALAAVACGGEVEDREGRSSALVGAADSCSLGDTDECMTSGALGMRICESGRWSTCAAIGNCRPDEGDPGCPNGSQVLAPCTRIGGSWEADYGECPAASNQGGGSSTPLVLSFDRAPVTFTQPAGSFDLTGLEASVVTEWVSSATPWLAVDLDGNGHIDDGAELFGSMTRLPAGRRARNGFEALAALDSDGDGRLTGADDRWSALVVWRDHDQDRRSRAAELMSVEEAGLVSIDLGYHRETRCTGTACEVERATFEFRAPSGITRGDVIDVHFFH